MSKLEKAIPLAMAMMTAVPAIAGTSGDVVISGTEKAPVRIICEQSPEAVKTGLYLRDFLKERRCPAALVKGGAYAASGVSTQIVLATSASTASLLPSALKPAFAKSMRDEAYVLDVRTKKTGNTILLVGKATPGLRAAAARFICKVVNDGKQLSISCGKEQADPFIKNRLIFVGNPSRRQVPFGSPMKDTDWETWKLARIRAYPQLFWQFGYNGLQACEVRGYSSVPDADMPRVRSAIQTLFKGAKDYNLLTSMFIWGDCLFDEGVTYSWNNPTERKIMRLYQKDLAKDYAPLLNHFVIHIGDPGGCTRDGCDLYKTPQQITASTLEQFRKVNPKITATLSTWANSFFWRKSPKQLDMSNYAPFFPGMASQTEHNEPIPDGAKFLDTSFMPADVGIALNRRYNADLADTITQHKRPVGIWSWYVGDNEMLNTYWFTMKQTDEVLSSMPAKARDQVEWETHELCWQAWPNVITAYVGSQKLWNPHRPLMDIEREFCIAAFGPQNADAVLAMYQVVENGGAASLPASPDFGTQKYHDQLSKVLTNAAAIKFPKGWKSNFAFPVTPQHNVELLVARVRLIQALSDAQIKVTALREKYGIAASPRVNALYFKAESTQAGQVAAANNFDVTIPLEPGHTIGVNFLAVRDFQKAGIVCFGNSDGGMTLSLYASPGGKLLARKVFASEPADQWLMLDTDLPAGKYYLEVSDPTGAPTGIYGSIVGQEGVEVYTDGKAVPKDPSEISELKKQLVQQLPKLPMDPMWNMDDSVAAAGYKVPTFAQLIERM